MKTLLYPSLAVLVLGITSFARVDTLRGVVQIEDATLYAYEDCEPEAGWEDCRRYNTGGCATLKVGDWETRDHRAVVRFPGWTGLLPDSSFLELYCELESDDADRRIFVYPLSRRFFEGVESRFGSGAYPSLDSGVTWNHAWLDIVDHDSLLWTAAGGDFVTAVACTMIVANVGQFARVPRFNRLLRHFDSTGSDPGVVLINENAFPANTAMKTFTSSEGAAEHAPRLLLYYPDVPVTVGRRRFQSTAGLSR